MGLGLLLWSRQHRNSGDLATNGGAYFLKFFGWAVITVASTGFMIEGLGGLIHLGNFWHQLAHETMYGVFLLVGFAALFESSGRLPYDSWRVAMCLAFGVEGSAFYGHQLEQGPVEAMLHFIMFLTSYLTALSFLWASREPSSLLPHLFGVGGMITKGLWFYVIANILYSGEYGVDGVNFMVASTFTYMGICVCSVTGFMGLLFIGKNQEYFENGWATGNIKYASVAATVPHDEA